MSTLIDRAVAEYFAAIRAMDVERCVAAFAEDAEQHDPVGAPPNIGHEEIRSFFTRIFSGFKTVALTEDKVYANGNSAAVKWIGVGTSHSGKFVTFEGIDVLDCDENGKVRLLRAFWDPAPVMAILRA